MQSFNLAWIKTDGFDIEGSYQLRNPFGTNGDLTLRALTTHVINLST